MDHWADIPQLASQFVLASFKGQGDPQKPAEALEIQYRRTKAYVELIQKLADDESYLASTANLLKQEMLNWRTGVDDPDDFLDLKEELFMLEDFLQHVFKKGEFARKKQARISRSREKNKQPLVEEKPVKPAVEEELM